MAEFNMNDDMKALLELTKQSKSMEEARGRISKDECNIANQRNAALKSLAEKINILLRHDDWDEFFKHLSKKQSKG